MILTFYLCLTTLRPCHREILALRFNVLYNKLEHSWETENGFAIDYQIGITTTTVDYMVRDLRRFRMARLDINRYADYSGGDNPDIADSFKKIYFVMPRIGAEPNSSPLKIRIPTMIITDGDQIISLQYLDCLCGTNGWDNPSGSGQRTARSSAWHYVEQRRTHQMPATKSMRRH